MKIKRKILYPLAITVALLALVSGGVAYAVNPGTATTTTGQALNIIIDEPVDGATVCTPGEVKVKGQVSIGAPPGPAINIIYVVDVSGSTENPTFNPPQDLDGNGFIDAGDDYNGDSNNGTALDAEIMGLIALNASLGNPSNVDVGLVAFGDGAKTADMGPAGGPQTFTSPPDVDANSNTTPDVEEVVSSLDTEYGLTATAGVGMFTSDLTANFALKTDYNGALTAMNAAFASQPAGETNIAFFLSDGAPTYFSTGPGSPLEAAVTAGTTIHTFGIGGGAGGSSSPGAPLREIADATGGSCTEVSDPSTLAAVLPGVTPVGIVGVTVNGLVASLNAAGQYECMVPVVAGPNMIQACVTAEDGTVACADITVIGEEVQLASLCPAEYRWSTMTSPPYKWNPFPTIFESWNEVMLVNSGPGDAYNVKATITCTPVNVTVVDGVVEFGTIPAGGSAWSIDDFALQTDMSNPQDPNKGICWTIEYDTGCGQHITIRNVAKFCGEECQNICP